MARVSDGSGREDWRLDQPTLGWLLRIGDAERDSAIAALQGHLAAGRLNLVEFQQRMSAACTATYDVELVELLCDLPQPDPGPTLRESVPSNGSVRRRAVALAGVALVVGWVAPHLPPVGQVGAAPMPASEVSVAHGERPG